MGSICNRFPETLPLPYETVKTNKCMRIQDIATALSISRDALCMMNSELRFQMTPDSDYNFKVPLGSAVVLSSQMDKIPEWEPPKPPPREFSRRGTHRVKRGESLTSIARRYRVSSQDLIAYNNMEGKRIRVGQRLKIPGKVSSNIREKSERPLCCCRLQRRLRNYSLQGEERRYSRGNCQEHLIRQLPK